MQASEIRILRIIQDGAAEVGQLLEASKLSKNQLYRALRSLQEQDYVERRGKKVLFKASAKPILFQDVSREIDVARALKNANERVFRSVIEPATITELKQKTGLSQSTVKKILIEMMSFGIVVKQGKKYALNKDNEKIVFFAKLLKQEYDKTFAEPHAEIFYRDHHTVLKRVPREQSATGRLTGLSLFTEYGILVETAHNYYTTQKTDLPIEEILVQALCFATGHGRKGERTLIMLCYLANKDMIDICKIRDTARRYGVDRIWLNIESYLKRSGETDMSLFLPWKEFVEKAELYDMPSEMYVPPQAYCSLFEEIGRMLRFRADAYVIGGENMRIKGLKDSAQDCDIAVLGKKDMRGVAESLIIMGYEPIGSTFLGDLGAQPSMALGREGRPTIRLFLRRVEKAFRVSPKMAKGEKTMVFSNLHAHMLKNEHVFLLKSSTPMEGSITDMITIMHADGFDWNIVWQEAKTQEKTAGGEALECLLKSLNSVYKMTGTKAPFLKSLMLKVLNAKMVPVILQKTTAIKDVVEYFEDLGLDEKMVRNGIDRMAKQGMLKKERDGRITAIKPARGLPKARRRI